LRRGQAAKALALSARDAVGAANLLCASPNAVRLALPHQKLLQERRKGVLPASFVLDALTLLRVCGVVAIQGLFEVGFVAELEAAHTEEFDPSALVGHVETDSVGSRSEGRYEVKLPLREPFTDARLTRNAQLLSLVKGAVAGDHLEIDTFSHVDALPGASMQVWHKDVDAVHHDTQKGELLHGPPQGLVVVVPLVEVNHSNGPTEFECGSHVNVHAFDTTPSNDNNNGNSNKKKKAVAPLLSLPVSKGDALLFDLRVRHRGTPNTSLKVRPILYLSYVHSWFRDEVNFKGVQSAQWASEFKDTPSRKLFMRLDQTRYVAQLEAKLAEKGVDVASMRSSLTYKAVDMRA